MLSTPPAIAIDISPVPIARAATAIASIPEAHKRFTVTPGTVCGMPESSSAIRATLRLSSPDWLAQPSTTSSIAAQSLSGYLARSVASV